VDHAVSPPTPWMRVSAAPAPAPAARCDGIDPSLLDDIVQMPNGGIGLVRELIAMFFDEAPGRLAELRLGIAAADGQRIAAVAHATRGGAGTVGATQLATLCGRLEADGRAGRLAGAEETLVAIEVEFARVRGALERRVAELMAGR